MSTKTTLKRIALVAVSALGFGMFTAVVPANAAPATVTSIVVGTVPQGRVDVTSAIPFKIYFSSMTQGDTLNINAELTAAPLSGGAANVASKLGSSYAASADADDNDGGLLFDISPLSTSNVNFLANDGNTRNNGTIQDGRVSAARTSGVADSASNGDGFVAATVKGYAITDADIALGYVSGFVRMKPDVTGTYTGLISATTYSASLGNIRSAENNEVFVAGDKSASFTFTTTGAPTAVSLSTAAGGTIHAGSPNGTVVAVTLTGGTLGALDSIELTASGNGVIATSAGGAGLATRSLTSTNFAGGQTALVWLRSTGTAAETITLTATSGGALAAFNTSKTYTVQKAAGSATGLVFDAPGADTTYGDASAALDSTTTCAAATTSCILNEAGTTTSQTLGFSWAGAAAVQGYYTVTDSTGQITGVAGLKYDVAYATAATTVGVSWSFAVNAGLVADGATLLVVDVPATSATAGLGRAVASSYTFKRKNAGASAGTITITPTTAGDKYQVAAGGGIAMTATLKDEYGNAWANKTLTVTTSGRNNPVATTAVTNASGQISFTSVDSSTSTTNLTDTVVFACSGTAANCGTAVSKTITLDYANTAASTVVLTGGSTSAGVTALSPVELDINAAAKAGVTGTTHTVTALVKDASGNAIVGKAVTWTISGTGCALLSTRGTSYTSTTGEATTSAYGWLAGTCTVTATVGTVSGTASLTFAQLGTNAEARTVSATASGSVVTAKVVDRFGNPMRSIPVYATKTGVGYFGNGLGRTTANTDRNGEAQFTIAGGDATVTVSVIDYDAAPGTVVGQTCALAGNQTCASATAAAVAFTATTAGTTTTAETGVGASFAPAGVASATVSVKADTSVLDAANAANDAAAEAIDAANAATDAANLAAEAADAATVAAEEARDAADAATAAVEELATQVATLMAALKAQITTLANTVAKIAKKVKA